MGTYTAKTQSKGIYLFEFSLPPENSPPRVLPLKLPIPPGSLIHPNGKFLYAVNESGKASTITAFSIDAKSGKLTQLNQLSALGEDPCYLSFDKTGKFLFVANYSSGNVAVFPILADGKLGEHTALQSDQGALVPTKNTRKPRTPIGSSLRPTIISCTSADLGLDRIVIYKFDDTNGTLTRWRTRRSFFRHALPPGDGPRHELLHPNGKFMYVLAELSSL